MNNKISIVSCFLIMNSFFSAELQITDSGRCIPKDIFFKIAEYVVPNLLTPMHPKEIVYQDRELKKYRLVCKKWRDLLDQRVDFDSMNRLFVQIYGWNNQKFFNYYKERLDILRNSYLQENKWFIGQYDLMSKNIPDKIDNKINEIVILNNTDLPLACKMYRKNMKEKLDLYDYHGLLMLEKYICHKGFLHTNSLTRYISNLYLDIKDNPNEMKQSNLLKKLTRACDLTSLFSRLLKRVIFCNDNSHFFHLQEASIINYKHFLRNIYVSFSERRTLYSYSIVRCSGSNNFESSIVKFFNFYSNVFSLKDSSNKYFLYYLLLYSKNSFFNIQLILLIDFIRGIEKKFADYPESDRIEYKNLFKKNFLKREEKISPGDSIFLKYYFGLIN